MDAGSTNELVSQGRTPRPNLDPGEGVCRTGIYAYLSKVLINQRKSELEESKIGVRLVGQK